jgi:hypothetical protein|tara:strand:- start:1130 stop:1444 length:315 start_codon:yes stop_codon:yes gene_type:complete
MQSEKLKIGILLDRETFSPITADLIDKLYTSKDVDLKYFLIPGCHDWEFANDKPFITRVLWVIKNKKLFLYVKKFIFGKIYGITHVNNFSHRSGISVFDFIQEK